MVLKHWDGISYERSGVLERTYFESIVKSENGTARLRGDDWDKGT